MSAQICSREDELLDAIGRGFVGAELAAHVAACGSCTELQLVAGALLDDRSEAVKQAAVPSAGTMWWRLQLRHRQDAQALARRSLLMGQAASLVIAIALIAAFFGRDIAETVKQVAASIHVSMPLFSVIATWLLLAPLAGWIAIRQK